MRALFMAFFVIFVHFKFNDKLKMLMNLFTFELKSAFLCFPSVFSVIYDGIKA